MRWILASASPRRKELLEKIGLTFEIATASGEETVSSSEPTEAVTQLSRQKAFEVANRLWARQEDGADQVPLIVIGADTMVAYQGEILGKPKDEADAFRMLSMLQGRCHKVYTGVTIVICRKGFFESHSFYEETGVVMHPMDDAELRWYIGTKEPFDKAGAYGIQGKCAIFIKEICGDYDNVVGLPVARLYQELKKLGISVLHDLDGIK